MLQIIATRTLKMSHDILCVKYSNTKDPSKLLVAVSLLDNTVKVVIPFRCKADLFRGHSPFLPLFVRPQAPRAVSVYQFRQQAHRDCKRG